MTRLSKDCIENDGVIALQKAEFSITTPKDRSSRPGLSKKHFLWQSPLAENLGLVGPAISSDISTTDEVVQFDVFERQGFDRIMQTVGNVSSDQQEIAKCLCDTFDAISSLAPYRYDDSKTYMFASPSSQMSSLYFVSRSVFSCFSCLGRSSREMECLVCCLPSLTEFHTTRFRAVVSEFIDSDSLDRTVSDLAMQLASRQHSGWLGQHFRHSMNRSRVLSLSAMTLSHVEGLVLIVARCEGNGWEQL